MWLEATQLPSMRAAPVVRIAEVGLDPRFSRVLQAVLHNAASDDPIDAIHMQHAVRSGS